MSKQDWTVKELADAAGVSVQYIHELLQAGKIPHYRVGNWLYLIPRKFGASWLSQRGKGGDAVDTNNETKK